MSLLPTDHPKVPSPKLGVLLINLGTPDALDYWSMRRYLGEFLSDKRVVELPKILWQLILQGPILTFRPKKSAAAYRQIWNNERDESPLRTITREQSEKLQERFGDAVRVEFAMRYGNPSIPSLISQMFDEGCWKILCIPMYPQYASSTTGSVVDKIGDTLKAMRWQPTIRVSPPFYDDPEYIRILARSVQTQIDALDEKPDVLVASFHGVPKEYLLKGDPYHCQCQKTTRLLKERLGWQDTEIRTTFQSKFGPEEWLKPYTVEEVARLAEEEGKKNIAVIAPAFSADCIETLEEINEEIKESFEEAGGEDFLYIPCLNDDPEHVSALCTVIDENLHGWAG